jgi:hypothetical protein
MTYHPVAGTTYNAIEEDHGTVALRVTSVSGNISFTYSISGYTVVSSQGADKEIQMILVDFGTKKFYIKSVTDANGDGYADTFTYKNSGERYNQDLYFEIEIVSIR